MSFNCSALSAPAPGISRSITNFGITLSSLQRVTGILAWQESSTIHKPNKSNLLSITKNNFREFPRKLALSSPHPPPSRRNPNKRNN
jgi:hypothetical protein